ncbi:hypothetical protein D3C75_789710 [compost metagenome]
MQPVMKPTNNKPAVCATIKVHGSLEIRLHSGNSVAAIPSNEISAEILRPHRSESQPEIGRNTR